VKSLGNLPDRFLAEIAGQPEVLRRAADGLASQREALARLAAAPGPVVFTGMGASYAACYPPVTALAGLGVQASMVDTAELLHFRRGLLGPGSILVLVSQSGRSAEAVRLAEELDRSSRPLLVTVTNGTGNPLAAAADVALDTRAGVEQGPSTGSFAACLVVLAAVAEVLGGRSVRDAVGFVRASTEAAASAAGRLLADPEDAAEGLARWFDERPTVVMLGRGGARAASEVGALVLKEAARVPAEALESAQFRHGPLELAGPGLAAAVVATEPATRMLDRSLAAELARAGASVLVIDAPPPGEPDEPVPGAAATIVIGGLDRRLAPAVAAVPFQLLAWRIAVDRGLRPGMLEIAEKVTTRE